MAKDKKKPKPPRPNIPAKEQAILADIYQTFRKMYGTGRGRKRRKRKVHNTWRENASCRKA